MGGAGRLTARLTEETAREKLGKKEVTQKKKEKGRIRDVTNGIMCVGGQEGRRKRD